MKLFRPSKQHQEVFQVLNGPTYTRPERPPFWHNQAALLSLGSMPKPSQLERPPLADFPFIEDFEIRLERQIVPKRSILFGAPPDDGYHLYFFSGTRGYLAAFPWWDHVERDLSRADFRMPLGDFAPPFNDMDQSWEIVIAAKDTFLYILEGDFDHPDQGYYSWFKTDRGVYLGEWQKAIELCRALARSLESHSVKR